MSTQAVRNIIRISMGRVIPKIKKRVTEEGRKKLDKFKEKLPLPREIINSLSSDIDSESCSLEGRDKLHEKAEEIKENLNKIETIIIKGRDRVQELEDKLAPLSDYLETPTTGPDPHGKIDKIVNALDPITKLLQKIIMIAPGILAASSGPAANGAVIANTNNSVNLAKSKIDEYANLIKSLPRLLDQYKAQANRIVQKITTIKEQINGVLEQINQLKMLIIFLETKFENSCNDFFANPNPPISEPPVLPAPLTVEEITQQFESIYEGLLNNLILQGDQIAIRRVFVLGEDFERIKNKIGDVKYTSIKKVNP